MNELLKGFGWGLGLIFGIGMGAAIAAFSMPIPSFEPDTPLSSSAMNANFVAISSELNALRAELETMRAEAEPVAALYTRLDPHLGARTNPVSFKNRVVDTGQHYSGNSFTVPVDGLYSIAASVSVSGNFGADTKSVVYVYVNGNYVAGNSNVVGASVPFSNPAVSINAYPLQANDRVSILVYSDAPNARFGDEDGNNYFSIQRISGD